MKWYAGLTYSIDLSALRSYHTDLLHRFLRYLILHSCVSIPDFEWFIIFKVASRFTMIIAGIMLILLGAFTKIGAVLSTIPDPLVGGVLASSMAMVGGVAIANIQQVKMNVFFF